MLLKVFLLPCTNHELKLVLLLKDALQVAHLQANVKHSQTPTETQQHVSQMGIQITKLIMSTSLLDQSYKRRFHKITLQLLLI